MSMFVCHSRNVNIWPGVTTDTRAHYGYTGLCQCVCVCVCDILGDRRVYDHPQAYSLTICPQMKSSIWKSVILPWTDTNRVCVCVCLCLCVFAREIYGVISRSRLSFNLLPYGFDSQLWHYAFLTNNY